jgi:hypothetical protein
VQGKVCIRARPSSRLQARVSGAKECRVGQGLYQGTASAVPFRA